MKLFRWTPFATAATGTAAVLFLSGVYETPGKTGNPRPLAAPAVRAGTPLLYRPEPFVAKQGESLVPQMRDFAFSSGNSEIVPARTPGLMAAVKKMSAAELEAACEETVSTTLDARTGELLQLFLYRWAELDPPGALQFIEQRRPEGLVAFCQAHPGAAVDRFVSATGWHPLEAALEHHQDLDGIWAVYTGSFVAAEAALPSHPSREAVIGRMTAAMDRAVAGLSSAEPAEREIALASGRALLGHLRSSGQSPGLLVSGARFLAASHKAPPPPPAGSSDPIFSCQISAGWVDVFSSETIALAFSNIWARDQKDIVAALRAIPSVEERDTVSRLIAESLGCTPFMGDEKLSLLRQTHSQWQSLGIVPQLVSHSGEATLTQLIRELPAGPVRDSCVLSLALRKMETAPAAALDTALQTASTPHRNNWLRTIYRNWSDIQPAAATAWLANQDPARAGFLTTPPPP